MAARRMVKRFIKRVVVQVVVQVVVRCMVVTGRSEWVLDVGCCVDYDMHGADGVSVSGKGEWWGHCCKVVRTGCGFWFSSIRVWRFCALDG